jgi:hypothetical protein
MLDRIDNNGLILAGPHAGQHLADLGPRALSSLAGLHVLSGASANDRQRFALALQERARNPEIPLWKQLPLERS